MESRSTLSRIGSTLSSISPYIFRKANSARLYGAGALTVVGMGLDVFVPLVVSETIKVFSTRAASAVLLGLELNPYTLVGISVGSFMLRNFLNNERNKILAPIAPHALKVVFNEYGRHAMARDQEETRNAKTEEDIVRMQKGYGAMYAITNQLFTVVVPVSLNTLFTSGVIAWRYGGQVGGCLAGIVVLCTGYTISTSKTTIKLRDASLESGNKSYESFLKALEYTETIQKNVAEDAEAKNAEKAHEAWAVAETKSIAFGYRVTQRQTLITDAGFAGLCFMTAHGVLSQQLNP